MCSFDIRVGESDISLDLLAGHSKIRPTASLSPKNEPSCHYIIATRHAHITRFKHTEGKV